MSTARRRSVLIVEDDHIDAEYILQSLARFDTDSAVYSRAYEAIAHIQDESEQQPSLVLLDWKISGGGASVLDAVRQSAAISYVPVVILSRSTADVDVRAAYAGRANAFVAKASELDDFQGQVAAICDFFLNIAQPPPPRDAE